MKINETPGEKTGGELRTNVRAVLNKFWRQHPPKKKQLPYGHLALNSRTMQIRQTRNVEHSWRKKNKLICDVLLSPHTHGQTRVSQSTKIYIQQSCVDAGCSLDDLLGAMDYREG